MRHNKSIETLPLLFSLLMLLLCASFVGIYIWVDAHLDGEIDMHLFAFLLIGVFIFFIFISVRFTSRKIKREFSHLQEILQRASDGDLSDCAQKGEFTFDELNQLAQLTRSKKRMVEHARRQHKEYLNLQKELSKTQDEYYASISYEVRTLINSVIGFSDLLKGTRIDDEQVDYLNSIRESGQILMILLNDVLDISKLEVGERSLEKGVFDFPNLIDNVIESLAAKTDRKSLHVNVVYGEETPRFLVGDKERIRRVLFNMMQSVIAVSRRGDMSLSIESSTKADLPQRTFVTIRITVSRLAVPKDKVESMVRVFSGNAEAVEGKYSGIGLRIFIVQQLIHFLGGALSVVFRESKGCEFVIGFDLEEVGAVVEARDVLVALPGEMSEDQALAVNLQGTRILVAEDNDINQKLLKVLLEKRNASVDIVSTGYEAVEEVIMHDYDLVIMDIKMPLMNGIDVTRFIRKELRKKMPVIALTAVARAEDEKEARQAGMNDFLTKPINTALLLTKIVDWTKKK
jgi:CheY-like chemotaxis protein